MEFMWSNNRIHVKPIPKYFNSIKWTWIHYEVTQELSMADKSASREVLELELLENDRAEAQSASFPSLRRREQPLFNEQTNYLPCRRVVEVRERVTSSICSLVNKTFRYSLHARVLTSWHWWIKLHWLPVCTLLGTLLVPVDRIPGLRRHILCTWNTFDSRYSQDWP